MREKSSPRGRAAGGSAALLKGARRRSGRVECGRGRERGRAREGVGKRRADDQARCNEAAQKPPFEARNVNVQPRQDARDAQRALGEPAARFRQETTGHPTAQRTARAHAAKARRRAPRKECASLLQRRLVGPQADQDLMARSTRRNQSGARACADALQCNSIRANRSNQGAIRAARAWIVSMEGAWVMRAVCGRAEAGRIEFCVGVVGIRNLRREVRDSSRTIPYFARPPPLGGGVA